MSTLARSGRELSKSEKILLGTVGIMSAGFICWTLILEPGLTKLKPLKQEVAELEARVVELGNLNEAIASKEVEIKALSGEYNEATSSFPKSDKYPELIKELRELIASLNLNLTSEYFGEPTVVEQDAAAEVVVVLDSIMSFNVDLTVEGDFNKALELVNKIESGKRIVEVENISTIENKTTISLLYYFSNSNEKEFYSFN